MKRLKSGSNISWLSMKSGWVQGILRRNWCSDIMLPSCGLWDGMQRYCLIGDVTRFQRTDQVVAYAGLDIEVKESGKLWPIGC